MTSQDIKKLNLPDSPGIYLFEMDKEIIYIGKATSLKDRVESYFSNDLIKTRGPLLVDMVTLATSLDFKPTNSVLEALILEASLIKNHQPKYNTRDKSDKSFNWVVITEEDFPRVLVMRERDLEKKTDLKILEKFGPFTQGQMLKDAMKIIRKIFPFRDICPLCLPPRPSASSPRQSASCKPCFNYQIGLCPGACFNLISRKDYGQTVRRLRRFLSGETSKLTTELKREMNKLATEQKFEGANKLKKTIFSLEHLQDIALLKNESIHTGPSSDFKNMRFEAYDIAHLGGKNEVGVMVVSENGQLTKNEYRKFNIRQSRQDDLAGLREMLERRLEHVAWTLPNIIVVDGDRRQMTVGKNVVKTKGLNIEVVAVVKDEKHQPKALIGEKGIVEKYREQILKLNAEAHRFAITFHRLSLRRDFLK